MKRRDALKLLGTTSGALLLAPWEHGPDLLRAEVVSDDRKVLRELERLRTEPAARTEVRVERGGPRLFLNGEEVYPLLALSTTLSETADEFKAAGIDMLAPLLGMRPAWVGPDEYNWTALDAYFAKLLAINPDAYFLLRLHLNTPVWWKDSHPDEIIRYGLPYDSKKYKLDLSESESGYAWGLGAELYEASWASEAWRKDTGDMIRAFMRHIENSPLKSRVLGYQPTTGFTGEWGYFGPHHLPDYSRPMQKACGTLPEPQARLNTTYGLLRDPQKESGVIDFYRHFHDVHAEAILYFARIIKETTNRRVLCGVFYAYLLENVIMQEIGNLAPGEVLRSDDIDYIVSPYSYLHTNIPERERWTSDIYDDAGNWLGRARGVGGDGAYRILLESLRRHKKLFIVEMDPSTYLEKTPYGEGGSGHETVEGTRRILRRDLGQMFVQGCGGWLYDFGPIRGGTGWYTSEPIINEIERFVNLGEKRKSLDISPVAEIVSVYDAKSFFVTQHWTSMAPYVGLGCLYIDYFNHWFLACQLRTFNRIGAPMDYLYRFDLEKGNAQKYRLLLMPNVFYLTKDEVTFLREILKDSGATVVWYYAPGFVSPEKLDLEQMERLTGFRFRIVEKPGPLMVDCDIQDGGDSIETRFGVWKQQFPRFSVIDEDAQPLGRWEDLGEVSFAMKTLDGWNSVYVGAAPLPVGVLRWLARKSGVDIWCSKPDIIYATRDAAMIVASEEGERVLSLPRPMADVEGGSPSREHHLTMDFGDVKIFTVTPQ